MGEKWVKTHLSPTFNPFRDFRENPLFAQFKGGGNCFLKRALRQSRPSINPGSLLRCPMRARPVLPWGTGSLAPRARSLQAAVGPDQHLGVLDHFFDCLVGACEGGGSLRIFLFFFWGGVFYLAALKRCDL